MEVQQYSSEGISEMIGAIQTGLHSLTDSDLAAIADTGSAALKEIKSRRHKPGAKVQVQIDALTAQVESLKAQIASLNAPKAPGWEFDYRDGIKQRMRQWSGSKLLVAHEQLLAPSYRRIIDTHRVAISASQSLEESGLYWILTGWFSELAARISEHGFEDVLSFKEVQRQYNESPLVSEEKRLADQLRSIEGQLNRKRSALKGLSTKARRKMEAEVQEGLLNGRLKPIPENMERSGNVFSFTAMLLSHCKHDTRHEYYQYSKWRSSRGYRTVGDLIHTFRLVDIKDEFGNSWPDMQFCESRHWYELLGDQEVKFEGTIVDGKLEFLRPDEASADIVREAQSK